MGSLRIDQARRYFHLESMVKARLIACYAGRDGRSQTSLRLCDEMRICKKWTRHRHHVSAAFRQDFFCDFRCIDPIGCYHGNRNLSHEFLGHPSEGPTRHGCRDCGDTGLVPPNPCIQNRRTGFFNGLCQQYNLVPCRTIRDQIDHRQTVDQNEIVADRFANPPNDLDRQAHSVLVRTTPAIFTTVRVCDEELIEEVTLRTHNLDAVIPCFACPFSRSSDVRNLLFDTAFIQFTWGKRRNRRFQC